MSSKSASVKSAEPRTQDRRDCLSPGVIRNGGADAPCTVIGIFESGDGMVVNVSATLEVGQKAGVETPEIGKVDCVVRWAAHPRYGLQLTAPPTEKFSAFHASLSLEHVLTVRTGFMELDGKAMARVATLAPLLAREMPLALDRLYRRIASTPGVRELFPTQALIDHAKSAQIRHWSSLTGGALTPAYLASVRRIGEAHARIGLEPHWYIGGYALMTEHLIESAINERLPRSFGRARATAEASEFGRTLSAFAKVVLLDVACSVSVYLDAANRARLEGEAAAVAHERNFVAASFGEALHDLAERRLSKRMKHKLPDVYGRIQSDFNHALDQIDDALGEATEIVHAVHNGVAEISKAADDLSARTERQAAAIQETASALNEVSGAVAATAASVKQAQQSMQVAHKDVEGSADVVRRAVETMQKIAGSSRKIVHFIGVIDEIAFQTNLLALNAGVEAARAGEAGRGFSVVAAEVRALALRAAEAAKEIKTLLSESGRQVDEGVSLVDATGETLTNIASQVTAINAAMAEVAVSSEQQATGLNEINVAMGEMEKVTHQNAAMAEQSTAACRAALGETERLSELIATFDLSQSAAARDEAPQRRVA